MNPQYSRAVAMLCMVLFLVQPVHFGVWLSRIAEVQSALAITNGGLSIALLGMPCGLLPSLFFAGRLVEKMGPRTSLLWSFPPMLFAGILPGKAYDVPSLFAALFVLGGVVAFVQVSLNVFAARTEKSFKIMIMNRAHGFWSLGIVVGSLLGIQFGRMGFAADMALILSAIVLLPALLLVAYRLPVLGGEKTASENTVDLPPIPQGIFVIVLVVFGGTITEGAMNDWATVYMRETFSAGTATNGFAVTVFAGMVTIGRFVGDALNKMMGPVLLARLCLASATIGIMTLVFSADIWLSFIGFGLVGFGVSTIFPLGISASAALSDVGEARNVSIMTFGALSGFLIGPPMIGYISELSSINLAFAALLPTLALSLVFSGRLSGK